jgi:hypothetical protein
MYYRNNRFLAKLKRNLPSSNLEICSKNVNPRERGDCRWWWWSRSEILQLSIPTQFWSIQWAFHHFYLPVIFFFALGPRLFFCLVNFLSGLTFGFRVSVTKCVVTSSQHLPSLFFHTPFMGEFLMRSLSLTIVFLSYHLPSHI